MRSSQFCKCAAGFAFLLTTSYSSAANAASVVGLIQPNKQVRQGLEFQVKRIGEGFSLHSKFTVEIVPKNVRIPSDFTASLSTVKIDSHSTVIKGIREINCPIARTIICTFTVSDAMLNNPDLGFVLNIPVFANLNDRRVRMPSSDLLYFKLKDIPLSDFYPWNKLLAHFTDILRQFDS